MRQRITIIIMAVGATFTAGVIATLFAVWAVREDAQPISAGELQERVDVAENALIASVRPDSTWHVREVKFRKTAPNQYTVNESWLYFDASGKMADYYVVSTDQQTGERLGGASVEGTDFVYRRKDGSEAIRHPFTGDLTSLRDILMQTQSIAATLVDPSAEAPTEKLQGVDAWVVEHRISNVPDSPIRRVYIHPTEYRVMKWEVIENGAIWEWKAVEAFEILDGNQIPASPAEPREPAPASTPASEATP